MPVGKVPVLEINGVMLRETMAIGQDLANELGKSSTQRVMYF